MKKPHLKLTYANVIATLALFVALGGSAYAATQLPKNSVSTKSIKKGAVTLAKIDPTAQAALKGQKGDPGAPGKNGTDGTKGAEGKEGKEGKAAATNSTVVEGFGTGSAFAACPSGDHLTGGGAEDESGGSLSASYPNTGGNGPSGWTAIAVKPADKVEVRLICASP